MANKDTFPETLMLRDTGIYDDLGGAGQRIYTTAGQGYEKQRYVRADVAEEMANEAKLISLMDKEEMHEAIFDVLLTLPLPDDNDDYETATAILKALTGERDD